MLKIVLYAAAVYSIVLIFLYVVQRHMTYFPDRSIYSPAEAGVPEMDVIELSTNDGLEIKAWYRPPTEPNLPTIVYFHGNAGNIAHRGFIVRPFLRLGYGVLLLTYRGYSGNPGSPSEEGLYNDARAAMDFLGDRGVSEKCTVLYGNSIGGAVAIQMATEYRVGAIVMQAPFSTLADVAQIHYAFFLPFSGLIKEQKGSFGIGFIDSKGFSVLIGWSQGGNENSKRDFL